MPPAQGFGHLDSLVDDIKKKESDRVKLESQLRQMRLRAESEAADASSLKSELEGAQAERMTLQKRIGLLTRKNEDLAGENAKLVEEKCDFQRSMANNEAKLKENEEDLRRAQREFVDALEKANAAYTRNRAVTNTLLGRKGTGCAEVPSPDELDGLKAAAAKTQEAALRAAELEARLRGVEAESQALKSETAESFKKQESLSREVVSWKEKAKVAGNMNNGSQTGGARGGENERIAKEARQRTSQLEQEVARLEVVCKTQVEYVNQLEEYANGVEASNAQLMQQLGEGAGRNAMMEQHTTREDSHQNADGRGVGNAP